MAFGKKDNMPVGPGSESQGPCPSDKLSASDASCSIRVRNLLVFAGCALAWLVLDLVSKAACEAQGLGATLAGNVFGLFRLHVVHNYGAAWNMFEGNVIPLALFAVLVCGALLAFAVHESKRAGVMEMLAIGLVFAGGLGNMIDRIARGFVVDMIDPLFINFPTFNVADIGVTCGIVILVVCLLLQGDSHGGHEDQGCSDGRIAEGTSDARAAQKARKSSAPSSNPAPKED